MDSYTHLAGVYDNLMYDVDYKKWAAYIDTLLKKYSAIRIFETACGTGNITRELIKLGYDIAASDVSPEMLRKASENARKEGLRADYILQDMRNIEVGNKVDAVVCACDGPNYLDMEGVIDFLLSAYNALKRGGVLLFDVSTKEKLAGMDGEVYFDDRDDVSCIWSCAYDSKKDALIMDMTVFIRSGDIYERFDECHVQYAHETEILRADALSAGFKSVYVYGFPDFGGGEKRAQFVCLK